MGMINCDIHGFSGIALVCSHIKELVNMGEQVRGSTALKIDLGDADFIVTYTFCQNCVMRFQLPKLSTVLPDSASDDFQSALETTEPVCGTCLTNLLE